MFFSAFFFLPCIKWQKMEREPSSFVLLTVGNKTQKSKVRLFNSSAFRLMGDCLQVSPRKGRTSCEADVKSCSWNDNCRASECHWVVVVEGVWPAAVHMCSSMSKDSCWPRHSSSINLQSSSWFLRAGCHLHQAGLYSFLRVFPGFCVS